MENMACKYREELVGKRFISVRSPVKLKIGKISEWEWRSGIVRAISSRDTSSLDLTVSFYSVHGFPPAYFCLISVNLKYLNVVVS